MTAKNLLFFKGFQYFSLLPTFSCLFCRVYRKKHRQFVPFLQLKTMKKDQSRNATDSMNTKGTDLLRLLSILNVKMVTFDLNSLAIIVSVI